MAGQVASSYSLIWPHQAPCVPWCRICGERYSTISDQRIVYVDGRPACKGKRMEKAGWIVQIAKEEIRSLGEMVTAILFWPLLVDRLDYLQ